MLFMGRHVKSRCVSHLHAIVARAHVADKPGCPLQHRSELIARKTMGTANYLLSHFKPSAFWRSLLIRASVAHQPRQSLFAGFENRQFAPGKGLHILVELARETLSSD